MKTDIFQPLKRRTKKAYTTLYDNAAYLFGRGSRTTLFPNGEREIVISNADGTASFRVRASDGPAGFAVTISSAVGSLPADAHILLKQDYRTEITEGVREITFISHYLDDYSQAFRRWYACDAVDGVKAHQHPSELGLTPRQQQPEIID